MDEIPFTMIFQNFSGEKILINKKRNDKVGEAIKEFLNKIQKSNLFLNLNIDNIYFIYNARIIASSDYEKKIYEYFEGRNCCKILVCNNYSKINYEII